MMRGTGVWAIFEKVNCLEKVNKTYLRAISSLLLLTFMWGLTFPLQKLVLTEDPSPFLYNAVRFWIATLLSLVFFGRGNWRFGPILGLVMGLAYANQTWGLVFTTAAKSGFITSIYVAIVPLFAFAIERERPTRAQIFGFLLTLAGLYLLAGNVENLNFGDLLTAVCGVLYALHVVLITRYSRLANEYSLLTPQFLTVAVMNTAFALFDRSGGFRIGLSTVAVATFTAVTATVLAIIIQAKYQKVVGNNVSALIYVGEPLFASILSALILRERLTMPQAFGGALIVSAMILGSVRFPRLKGRKE